MASGKEIYLIENHSLLKMITIIIIVCQHLFLIFLGLVGYGDKQWRGHGCSIGTGPAYRQKFLEKRSFRRPDLKSLQATIRRKPAI